jgi:ferredoxin
MRVTIDAERCAGHGVCVGLCPEVFELSDDGYAIVVQVEVPSGLHDVVAGAVRQCPTLAISVT